MKNKKLIKIILFLLITFNFYSYASAIKIRIIPNENTLKQNNENQDITRKDFYIFLSKNIDNNIKSDYENINLNFLDIGDDKELKKAMQILVYKNVVKNKDFYVYPEKKLKAQNYFYLINKNLGFYTEITDSIKIRNTKFYDLKDTKKLIDKNNTENKAIKQKEEEIETKKKIFSEVYEILEKSHYDKKNLDKIKMLDGAIKGLTEGTNDKYTTYFPPQEKKIFDESLSGEFVGIGAYVEMKDPGEIFIISPISGSPAEKAGIKGGDMIIKVGYHEVTKENSLNEVVSWIKGEIGTKVNIGIKRKDQILNFEVTRDKIIVNEIDLKLINSKSYLIKIKNFGDKVNKEFKDVLGKIKENKNIRNIVIDLRNNPGGYLDKVNDMLSYMVKKDDPISVIKYTDRKIVHRSYGYELLDFSKYKIIIVQNGGTASASEIMIGTIKDYYPKTITIGEKTYGKGSVQTIKSFKDGSAIKWTVAKWFTGKTETTIDKVGIKPDYEVIQSENDIIGGHDSQMQKVSEFLD